MQQCVGSKGEGVYLTEVRDAFFSGGMRTLQVEGKGEDEDEARVKEREVDILGDMPG